MNLFQLIFLSLSINLCNCEIEEKYCKCENIPRVNSNGIFNGTREGTEVLNFVVSIYYKYIRPIDKIEQLWDPKYTTSLYIPFCTGSLINSRWVLTSGYCIDFIEQGKGFLNLYSVAAGLDHDITKIYKNEKNHRSVKQFFKHEKYEKIRNGTFNDNLNDIGLIYLEDSFEFGNETGINPACLIDRKIEIFKNDPNTNGEDLFTAGYGRLNVNKSEILSFHFLDLKQEEEIKSRKYVHHDFSQAESRYLYLTSLKQEMNCPFENAFCAYNQNSNLCAGDSGGPLLYYLDYTLYVIGLTTQSILKTGNNVEYYCKFQSIYPYLSWINSHIGDDQCKMV